MLDRYRIEDESAKMACPRHDDGGSHHRDWNFEERCVICPISDRSSSLYIGYSPGLVGLSSTRAFKQLREIHSEANIVSEGGRVVSLPGLGGERVCNT